LSTLNVGHSFIRRRKIQLPQNVWRNVTTRAPPVGSSPLSLYPITSLKQILECKNANANANGGGLCEGFNAHSSTAASHPTCRCTNKQTTVIAHTLGPKSHCQGYHCPASLVGAAMDKMRCDGWRHMAVHCTVHNSDRFNLSKLKYIETNIKLWISWKARDGSFLILPLNVRVSKNPQNKM
jgi:hypothetical protein